MNVVLFDILVIIMILVQFKLYHTIINPFILIASVYVVLLSLNNLLATYVFDFYAVSNQSMLSLFCFLSVIFICSTLFSLMVKKRGITRDPNRKLFAKKAFFKQKKKIIIAYYLGVGSHIIALVVCIHNYGIRNLKGSSAGVFSHLAMLAAILTPIMVFYIMEQKAFVHIIPIMIDVSILLCFGGKYNIIFLLLHTTFVLAQLYKISGKIVVRSMVALVLLSLLMFVCIYTIKPYIMGDISAAGIPIKLLKTIRHFFIYLLGPVIAMNYFFAHQMVFLEGVKIILTVPLNIYIAIFGNQSYISPIYPSYFIPIADDYQTNVGGMYAESSYNVGLANALLYIFIVFVLIYIVYFFNLYRGRFLLLGSFLLTIVSMSFFCNFLTVSGIVLRIIWILLFEMVLWISINREKKLGHKIRKK